MQEQINSKAVDKIQLSVIIPTINSESFIEKTVLVIKEFLDSRDYIEDYEIVLSPQVSKDKTIEIVKEISKKYDKINFVVSGIKGKGIGITNGIKKSTKPWIMFIDDDLAYPTSSFLDQAIKYLDSSDVIIGSRKLIKQENIPLKRRITSKGYITLTRILFGLKYSDIQAGIKMFRREIFDRIPLPEETGFVWDTEFLYYVKKSGLRVKEIPVTFDYVQNQIKVVKTSSKMFISLIKLFYRERIKKTNSKNIKSIK